ncbi:MAG: pseudouridine synthase [Candidatus Margulisiibacteriota bacterium]
MKNTRLHKFIAECGVTSRRKAEELISLGRIRVNGQRVTEQGLKIDPLVDKVSFDGKIIHLPEEKIYLKFNKPIGVVSSCRKFPDEKSISDFVRNIPQRLYPVGRLDKDSAGLMLLTNDGELANHLMHPRYEHEKEYEVNVQSPVNSDQLRKLERGILLSDGRTLPAKVFKENPKCFRIILKEGRKRQIRRMLEAVGNRVDELIRIRIGSIRLGNLDVGEYKPLTEEEVSRLKS